MKQGVVHCNQIIRVYLVELESIDWVACNVALVHGIVRPVADMRILDIIVFRSESLSTVDDRLRRSADYKEQISCCRRSEHPATVKTCWENPVR
jgi:hypothetical protein